MRPDSLPSKLGWALFRRFLRRCDNGFVWRVRFAGEDEIRRRADEVGR